MAIPAADILGHEGKDLNLELVEWDRVHEALTEQSQPTVLGYQAPESDLGNKLLLFKPTLLFFLNQAAHLVGS